MAFITEKYSYKYINYILCVIYAKCTSFEYSGGYFLDVTVLRLLFNVHSKFSV